METIKPNQHPTHAKMPELMDYYHLLKKRRGLILISFLLIVITTGYFTFSEEPIYLATATVLADESFHKTPLTGQEIGYSVYQHLEKLKTHIKIITSRPVLENLLDRVDLQERTTTPEDQSGTTGFLADLSTSFKSDLRHLFVDVVSAFQKQPQTEELLPVEEQLLLKKIGKLRHKITIEEVRDTNLLNIHVLDHDPRTAQSIANTLAEVYVHYDSNFQLGKSHKILDWLNKNLLDMRKNLEDAEQEFIAFKEKENIFSIKGQQDIYVQKMEQMNVGYIDARTLRLEVEAKIQELKKFVSEANKGNIRNVPTFKQDDLVENLYAELLVTEVRYKELSKEFLDQHPEMLKVASKIDEMRVKILQQAGKTLANLKTEHAVLISRENAMQEALKSLETDAINTNRKEIQYRILGRNVTTNRKLYDTLLSRIKEENIIDEVTATNLHLVEPASLPLAPHKPNIPLNLMIGVILGLFTGVSLAFLMEYMDQSLHTRKDVERHLGFPVLSEIPPENNESGGKKTVAAVSDPAVLQLQLNGQLAEAYTTLATNLRFSDLDRPSGVYLVTSSIPEEGKSTVCFNLGLTMARIGIKTLVMDTDLRWDGLKDMMGLPENRGLTEILVDTFNTKTDQGTLGDLSIADIHKILEIQGKSGTLKYKADKQSFAVSFFKGQIIDVDWLTRPLKQRLGDLLVQNGKITREQAQIALTKQKNTSQRLGQVLLHMGFINVDELAGPLRLHLQENIRELHRYQENGHKNIYFTFEENSALQPRELDPKEGALIEAMGKMEYTVQNDTPFLLSRINQQLFEIENENLWVLPSGHLPPNPAELLTSKRMRVLVDLLRNQFELILMDSPPVGAVNDAAVLTAFADHLIFVIKAGSTPVNKIRQAAEQLNRIQAPITGTVLNMAPLQEGSYIEKYHLTSSKPIL